MLATLAFQSIVFSVLYNWNELTGGVNGLSGIGRPVVAGHAFNSSVSFLALSGAIAVLVGVLYWQLARSPYGRAVRAVREDRIAAVALGGNPFSLQFTALAIAAALAGLAGAIWASWAAYIDPTSFSYDESIYILTVVIVGGLGNTQGPLLGTAFMVFLPEVLRMAGIPSAVAPNARQIVFGLALILTMRWRRKGLWGDYALE